MEDERFCFLKPTIELEDDEEQDNEKQNKQATFLRSLLKNAIESNSFICQNRKLEEIPKEIFTLTNLTELNLSGNLITEIPQNISQLTNLTSLDLTSNKIQSLPLDSFRCLTNLKYLNLENNFLDKEKSNFQEKPRSLSSYSEPSSLIEELEEKPKNKGLRSSSIFNLKGNFKRTKSNLFGRPKEEMYTSPTPLASPSSPYQTPHLSPDLPEVVENSEKTFRTRTKYFFQDRTKSLASLKFRGGSNSLNNSTSNNENNYVNNNNNNNLYTTNNDNAPPTSNRFSVRLRNSIIYENGISSVTNGEDSFVPSLTRSMSSFSYSTKAKKTPIFTTKFSKSIRDEKNQWKKRIG